MLKVYGLAFTATMADLGRAIEALNFPNPEARVAYAMGKLERDLPGLPLSPVVREEFNRLKMTLREPNLSQDAIRTALYGFESNLHQDLLQHSYLLVPASHRPFFETPNLFGTTVADEFEDAERDIAAAGRCIALDEWTAAVFHLMRVAEIGLQRLADGLGIKNAKWEEWESFSNKSMAFSERWKMSPSHLSGIVGLNTTPKCETILPVSIRRGASM